MKRAEWFVVHNKNTMKPSILILFWVLTSHLASAQIALKTGATYSYQKSNESTSSQLAADIPSLFVFLGESRYFEAGFEALKFSNTRSSSGPTIRDYETVVSPFFEYGFIKGNTDNALKFKIGAKATLNNNFSGHSPRYSTEYPFSAYESTITLAVKPGLLYAVNEKIFLDFVVPINILNAGYYRSNLENPAIPIRQQQQSSLRSAFFPETYQVSLGIIYRPG